MADFKKFSNEVSLPDWLDKVRLLAELDSRLRQGELTGLDLTETEWGQVQSRKTWQRMLQRGFSKPQIGTLATSHR